MDVFCSPFAANALLLLKAALMLGFAFMAFRIAVE